MYALSIPLLASSVAFAQTPSTSQSHIYTGPLTRARLSQVSPERVVVSADSIGDLPGLLTLTLDVAPDGQITAGQWALVVSYVQRHFVHCQLPGDGHSGLAEPSSGVEHAADHPRTAQ
jgi:hypothetical protein